MKKIHTIIFLLTFISRAVLAQISFTYDNAGNRTLRKSATSIPTCSFAVNPTVSNTSPVVNASITLQSNCLGPQCSGATYSWSKDGATVATGASPAINVPGLAGSYTYQVQATNGSCNAVGSVTVNVSGGTTLTQVCANSGGDACSSNSADVRTFTLTMGTGGTSDIKLKYRSYNGPSVGQVKVGNGSWQAFNVVQTPGITDYLETTIPNVSLAAGSNTIQLATNSGYICFGGFCTTSTTAPTACTYTVSPTASNGSPAANSSISFQSNCSGAQCSGATYTWTKDGVTIATGSSPTINVPGLAGSYTYNLTAVNGSCSTVGAVTIDVAGTTAVTQLCANSGGDACSNNAADIKAFTVTVGAGGNSTIKLKYRSYNGPSVGQIKVGGGSWQTFNVAQTPGITDYLEVSIPNINLAAGSNTIQFATNSGFICFGAFCTNSTATPSCNYTVNPTASNTSPAVNSTTTLQANCSGAQCNGATYTWTKDGGAVGSGANATVTVPGSAGSYSYSLNAVSGSCTITGSVTISVSGGGTTVVQVCANTGGDACSANAADIKTFTMATATGGANFIKLKYRSYDGPSTGRIKVGSGSWQTFNVTQTPGILDYQTVTIPNIALVTGNNTIQFATSSGFICFGEFCTSPANTRMGLAAQETPSAVETNLVVSPNPSSGTFEVGFYLEKDKDARLVILNAEGRPFYERRIKGRGHHAERIILRDVSTGVFFVQLIRESGIEVGKVLIVR